MGRTSSIGHADWLRFCQWLSKRKVAHLYEIEDSGFPFVFRESSAIRQLVIEYSAEKSPRGWRLRPQWRGTFFC